MIDVPQSFRDAPRWWHDAAGRAWLDHLPVLVASQCELWDLVIDGPLLHGSNALVVPVLRGVQPAVLRLAPPSDDVASEAAALAHWGGRGVVRLLDADPSHGATLLERLDYSRTLLTEPLLEAVSTLASLTRTLAVPAPPAVPTTRHIAAEAISSFSQDWQNLEEPTPRKLLDRAIEAATILATQEIESLSVNGDLHFEQVLAGSRRPWTVVDPVLLRGDPEYDVGRVLWSRLDELPTDREVRAAFAVFVEAAEVPEERARAWILVRSMSYLLWGLQRGLTWDPPKCRRLLELFSGA